MTTQRKHDKFMPKGSTVFRVWIQNASLRSSELMTSPPLGEGDIFSIPQNLNDAVELWLAYANVEQ